MLQITKSNTSISIKNDENSIHLVLTPDKGFDFYQSLSGRDSKAAMITQAKLKQFLTSNSYVGADKKAGYVARLGRLTKVLNESGSFKSFRCLYNKLENLEA